MNIQFTTSQTGDNHTDNQTLETLRFERGAVLAIIDKIIEVLDNRQGLSQTETEFLMHRARHYQQFAEEVNDIINRLKAALSEQNKASNAHLN